MNTITVFVHSGELKHEWDGHYYNKHIIQLEKNESLNPNSDLIELRLYCMMCEESHGIDIRTESGFTIDVAYAYLVGQFDSECPAPRDKIKRAAKETVDEHSGQPLTNQVRMEMRDDIRAVCDEPVQVTFE